jgi:hypothetical protein
LGKHDEEHLAALATTALGGEDVLGAAVLYLAAELPSDVLDTVGDDPPGGAAGRAVAKLLANDGVAMTGFIQGSELAKEKGWTDKVGMAQLMLVAVTEPTIHVFLWKDDGPGDEVAHFDRASTDVHLSAFMGVNHFSELHDRDSDDRMQFIGYTGPLPHSGVGSTRKPTKLLLSLLTPPDPS